MSIVIKGGTIVDTISGVTRENRGIEVTDGRISCLDSHERTASHAITTNGYILPGLVNLHEHFTYRACYGPPRELATADQNTQMIRAVRNAHLSVARGITTVRELGGRFGINHAIARAVNEGRLVGPRTYSAGQPLAITGGHAAYISTEVNGADEARAAVRHLAKTGTSWVKIMASEDPVDTDGPEHTRPDFSADELAAITSEARARGLKSTVHCMGTTALERCINAGVDSIEHGVYLTPELATAMTERGIVLVPTISSYRRTLDETYQRGADWNRLHAHLVDPHTQSVKHAIVAGVTIGIGTDSIGEYVEEIEILCDLGMPTATALRAATLGGAELLAGTHQFGSIQVGMAADLLVVDDNPLSDPSTLRRTSAIVVGGRPFRPQAFAASLAPTDLPAGGYRGELDQVAETAIAAHQGGG